MSPRHILTCLAVLLSFLCWAAETDEDGRTIAPKANKENFKGEDHLKKLAKDDNKRAQLELGISYLTGKNGFETDPEDALYWLERAASQDKRSIKKKLRPAPRALLYLGFCYDNEAYAKFLGLKPSKEKALHYYLLAEKSGYREAAQYVAYALRDLGRIKEALEYYKRAADRHIQTCQLEYSRILLEGKLCKADPDTAISYLKHAALRGNSEAQLLLADIYGGKHGVEPNPNEMVEYLWQAATKNPKAMARMGYCYQYGIGISQDPVMAVKWYKRASSGNKPDPIGMAALAKCYSLGIGVDKDEQKAFLLYLKAASQRKAPALTDYNVAIRYMKGLGTKPDGAQAFNYFQRAAAKGLPQAMAALSVLYKEGNAYDLKSDSKLPADPAASLSWLQKAAEAGDIPSKTDLAKRHLKGEGVKQDKERAKALLMEASKAGNEEAQRLLGKHFKVTEPTVPRGF